MEEMLRLLQADCEIMRNGHETELSELEHIVNAMEEMKYSLKALSDNKVDASTFVNELPRVPLEALIPAELMEEDVERLLEEETEDVFASSGVDLSDPDRPLSPEDIAALVAAASGGAEPEPVEEPEEPAMEELLPTEPEEIKEPEDAFASSGVDLSDPNRTLSPDDIAALIASLGN